MSELLTDDEIYYRLGVNVLGFRKEDISDRNRVIAWAKDKLEPLARPEQEFIPRSEWDLDSLKGATVEQIDHRHFDQARARVYETFKPQHSTAVVMLCANKKPYHTNANIKIGLGLAERRADVIICSNPGVIPLTMDNLYPFRYYEWDESLETPEVQAHYEMRLTQWIGDFFTRFDSYKTVICYIRPGQTHEAFLKAQMPQKKIDIFNEEHMARIKEYCPHPGIQILRSLGFTISRQALDSALFAATGKKLGVPTQNIFDFIK